MKLNYTERNGPPGIDLKMNTWVVLLAALAAFAATATAEKKVVCYFGSWAVYRPGAGKFDIGYIEPELCTHLIYTFVGITTEGDVRVLDAWQDLPNDYGKDGFRRFNELRAKNPKVKTLIAIGGWNEGSAKYSQVVSNPATRAKFVQNVVAFLQKYKFDGFDLDWEYPNQRGGKETDVENFDNLVRELRQAFDPYGYLLTAAVGAAETSASKSYNIAEMSKHLHFINLMTYDLHGSWEKFAGINAPLYGAEGETGDQAKLNVDSSVKYWLDQGAPAEKLIVGVPFYGRSFTLDKANVNGIGSPASSPGTPGPYTRDQGFLGYNEICTYLKNKQWTYQYHPEQRTPYAYNDRQWVGYDNARSLTEKGEYINKHGLGGVMVWSVETDDFRGTCHGMTFPLLRVLNHVLGRGPAVTIQEEVAGPPPNQPPVKPPVNPSEPEHPVEQPELPPVDHSVCTQEGYVRDPKDCSIFYLCQRLGNAYNAVRFVCPDNLGFDLVNHVCNFREKVNC